MNHAENYCRIIKRMSNRNVLPPEYQQVEYLWSNANQGAYIKTGFIPTQRFKTVVRVQYRQTDGLIACGSWNGLGAMSNITNQTSYGIWARNTVYFYTNPTLNNTVYTNETLTNFVECETVTLIEDWITPVYNVEKNGLTYTSTPNNYFPVFNYNEFFLFGRNQNGNLLNNGSMKIYRAEIFDSQLQPVRNYIPCYRRLDNKPGMYDTVNHTFNTNAGHGADFTLGADV